MEINLKSLLFFYAVASLALIQASVQSVTINQQQAVNYGCVKFEVPGDDYFILNTTNQMSYSTGCINQCLSLNSRYQFAALSNFLGDFFCDCFLDDTTNNQVIYSGYCNLKCNNSCSSGCEYCGSEDGSFVNKYMMSTSTTLKPISNFSNIVNRPTQRPNYQAVNYGCVEFDTAGDYWFDFANKSIQIPNPNKCITECISINSTFQFFILSYFQGDFFCDCLFDDSINNRLAYSNYCNKKCDGTCANNCDICGSNDGFFASKYMMRTSKTLQPIVKKTKVLYRPTKTSTSSFYSTKTSTTTTTTTTTTTATTTTTITESVNITRPNKTLTGHTDGVTALSFYPENNFKVASGSVDSTIRIWDMGNWSTTKTLTGHTGGVSSLAYRYFWPTSYFISGSLDKTIRVWNVSNGTTIKILTGHTGGVTSLFFYSFYSFQLNKLFNVLISGSTDATIRIWDFEQDWNSTTILTGHTAAITSLTSCISSNYDDLYSGSEDKTIRTWNITGRTTKQTLTGHTDGVTSMLCYWFYKVQMPPMAPIDVRYLVSGSRDQTIRLWNTTSYITDKTLIGHTDMVLSLASLDDGSLVSGSNKEIRIWNIDTGETIEKLIGHTDFVNSFLKISSYSLLSASNDKNLILWSINHPMPMQMPMPG